jgi:hypothetical protein
VEWPELLRRWTEALRQYTIWAENGCRDQAPMMVDPTGVQGPLPPELRAYAMELAAQTQSMERRITARLAELRSSTSGRAAPVRNAYDPRPVPRYLDATG